MPFKMKKGKIGTVRSVDRPDITVKLAKAQLRELGVVIRSTGHGEYRVALQGAAEASAYYGTSIQDAYETGLAMARKPSPFSQRDRFMAEARTLYAAGGDAKRVQQLVKLAYAAHRSVMRRPTYLSMTDYG